MYYKSKHIYLQDYICKTSLSQQEIQRNLKKRTEQRRTRAGIQPSNTLFFEGEVYEDYFHINPIVYGTFRFPNRPFKINIEGKNNTENNFIMIHITIKISVFLIFFLAFLVMLVKMIAFPVASMSESNNVFARAVFFSLPFLMTIFVPLTTYWITKKQVAKHKKILADIFEIKKR